MIDSKLDALLKKSRKKRRVAVLKKIVVVSLAAYSAIYWHLHDSGRQTSLQQAEVAKMLGESAESKPFSVDSVEALNAPSSAQALESGEPQGESGSDRPFEYSLDTFLPEQDKEDAIASLTFQRKDTLVSALTRLGVEKRRAVDIAAAVQKQTGIKSVVAGQELEVVGRKNWTGSVEPLEITVNLDAGRRISVNMQNNRLQAKLETVPLKQELFYASGIIRDSFYETAIKMGVPSNRMSELINLFRYDVDFQREVKAGDEFNVIIERYYTEDGKFAHFGKVLYTALKLKNQETYAYYYFSGNDGTGGFYNADGESIRKALLKTPVNAAKITSGFGMRRHPVMAYTKMHKGVDFAAPTGTPILAAGDGVVESASRMGGYGNYLKIRHNEKYSTAYGHISRFVPGMRPGARVKQGQVVAYVGSTGISTGPHLHFEVLVNGDQVNPLNVKFASGKKLAGKELAQFKAMAGSIKTYLASVPKPGEPTKLASNIR